jgi:hypothetical protein
MKYTIEEIIDELQKLTIYDPGHIELKSNGYGEFPNGYQLTKNGANKLKEVLNKRILLKEDVDAGFQGIKTSDGLSGFRG